VIAAVEQVLQRKTVAPGTDGAFDDATFSTGAPVQEPEEREAERHAQRRKRLSQTDHA
jgi:hypothetical protein